MLQPQRNNIHDLDDDIQRQRLIASDQSIHRSSYGAIDDDVISYSFFCCYYRLFRFIIIICYVAKHLNKHTHYIVRNIFFQFYSENKDLWCDISI